LLLKHSDIPSFKNAYTLDKEVRNTITTSILCLKLVKGKDDENNNSVISTAIVWDYCGTNVLILTNYHTWVTEEFRPFFPPLMKARKKKIDSDEEDDNVANVTLSLCDSMGKIILEFDLESSLFTHSHKEYDFAILSLPRENFNMPRIPITLVGVDVTLKVHALALSVIMECTQSQMESSVQLFPVGLR